MAQKRDYIAGVLALLAFLALSTTNVIYGILAAVLVGGPAWVLMREGGRWIQADEA